jgi:hypothetical protein
MEKNKYLLKAPADVTNVHSASLSTTNSLSQNPSVQQQLLDNWPILLSAAVGVVGVGLAIWYWRRKPSEPSSPQSNDSRPKLIQDERPEYQEPQERVVPTQTEILPDQGPIPTIQGAPLQPQGLTETVVVPAQAESTVVATAFQKHLWLNITTLSKKMLEDADHWNETIHEDAVQNLVRLYEQCETFPDPLLPLSIESYHSTLVTSGQAINKRLNLHFLRLFHSENDNLVDRSNRNLFERLFDRGHVPDKAEYILNALIDPHFAKIAVNWLDVGCKGWANSIGDYESSLYIQLTYFFEFARTRAMSGHIPLKLQTNQLEWAMIDLEVRIDNLVKYVTTHPDGQDRDLMRKNILQISAPTTDQIMQKYELYKAEWNLPDLFSEDIKLYVESLANNYSTALNRYASEKGKFDLIRGFKLQNFKAAQAVPEPAEPISSSSTQLGASSPSLVGDGASSSTSGNAGTSSSSSGPRLVPSPFELSVKNELSALIGPLELLPGEFASPGIACILILLAFMLCSAKWTIAPLLSKFRVVSRRRLK